MISCNLKGGLGNMLFQIATTISFSIEKETDFNFPNLIEQLNYLNNEQHFNKKLNYANEYMLFFKNFTSLQHQLNITHEYPFHYIDFIPNEKDFLINGFFQSEKYFIKNRKKILEYFKISDDIKKDIYEKYNFFNKKLTSIHIRRGDYTFYPNLHPVLPIEYYNKSIELMTNETDLFLIFSDDLEWCKNNIKIKNVIFIENEKDYIELYLMTLCHHNIIANSSFSWWGAWLNNNIDKIVIAPKKWFGDLKKEETKDIIPKDWLKI